MQKRTSSSHVSKTVKTSKPVSSALQNRIPPEIYDEFGSSIPIDSQFFSDRIIQIVSHFEQLRPAKRPFKMVVGGRFAGFESLNYIEFKELKGRPGICELKNLRLTSKVFHEAASVSKEYSNYLSYLSRYSLSIE